MLHRYALTLLAVFSACWTLYAAPSSPLTAEISYANSPYCADTGTAGVTFSGTSTGGTYSAEPAGLVIDAASGSVTLGASVPGSYTVSYTFEGSVIATAPITVTALPAASISYGGTPYCSNEGTATVTLTGTSGGSFSSTPGLAINASGGAVNLAASTPGSYVVTYTIAAAGGCGQVTTTAPITITALPTASISYSASPYCSNEGIADVTLTGTSGGTYSSAPGLAINSATGAIDLAGSTAGVYTVTYTIPAANGCGSVTANTSVTVTQLPAATISYANTPYCTSGGTATVTRTGTAGGTYSAAPAGLTLNASTGAITLASSTPGTYNVTYTLPAANGCGSVTANASVTVTQLPAATISYANTPYCTSGGTATVTRTGTAGGTYSAAPAGLTLNASTGAITLASSTPGTYNVTYTLPAANGCGSVTVNASVTVTQLPAATISYANTPYCTNGGTATVTRTGASGGSYSAAPTGLTLNASTGAITLGSSAPGTYTVTYTIPAANGCGTVTANTSVTVTQLPAATISYANTPYCTNGGTATVTRTGTAGGTYSSAPAGLALNVTTGEITLASSTPGTYTVTYTIPAASGCGAVTTNANVTVTPLPAATISYAGSPYCSNAGTANVTRTGTGGGTYSSTTGLVINASTGAINLGASTAGSYTVTYTIPAANGCNAVTATAPVTITALPVATISYPGSPYCSTVNNASVTRTGNNTGTFSSTAGLSINAANGLVNVSGSTPGTYVVTYTIPAAGGCGIVTTTTSITITPLPTASISYAGSPYCANTGTATVSRTGATGGTYSSTPGLVINPATGAVDLALSTPNLYTVTYTVPAGSGCPQVTATASIRINPAPTQYNVTGGSNTICTYDAGIVFGLDASQSGTTYQLLRNNASVAGAAAAGTGAALQFPAQTQAGTYTVRATNNTTGCTSVMAGFGSILINSVTAGTVSDQTICEDGTANLTVSGAGGTGVLTYQWERSSDNVTFTTIGFATEAYYVTTPLAGTVMFYRRITTSTLNGAACVATSNAATVTVAGSSTVETVVAGDWNSGATWGGSVPGQDAGTLSCPVVIDEPVTLTTDLTIRDGVFVFENDLINTGTDGFLTMVRATKGAGGQYRPERGVLDIREGDVYFPEGGRFENTTLIVRNGGKLILGPSACEVCNCLNEDTYDADACAALGNQCTQNRFIIDIKTQIYVESGGIVQVYGNVVNTNNQGNMLVNGNVFITGNYNSSTGNVSITQEVDGNGDMLTCGAMKSLGSSTIYGSTIDCESGICSASALKCAHTVNLAPFGFVGYCLGTELNASTSLTTHDPPPAFTLVWQYNLDGGPTFTDLPDQQGDLVYNWPAQWPHKNASNQDVRAFYRVRVTTGNSNQTGCTAYSLVAEVVPGLNRWRGKEEVNQAGHPEGKVDDWHWPQNWCKNVPNENEDITIVAGTPTVYGGDGRDANVRNLTLNAGAVIFLQGDLGTSLQIYGDLVNDGTINATGTTLSFRGADVKPEASVSGTGQFNFHRVTAVAGKAVNFPNTDVTVNISGDMEFSQATLNQGSSIIRLTGNASQDIDVNGNNFNDVVVSKTGGAINLTSPVNLLGRLDVVSATAVNSNGNLKIRSRGISTADDGSIGPLAAGASVNGNVTAERYMDPLGSSAFRYIASPVSGTAFPAGINVMHRYVNGAWVRHTSSLLNGEGYAAMMYNPAQLTWSGTGTVITGSKTWNFPAEGWYLIGNPYPSAIQWSNASGAWTLNNVSTTIAVTDNSIAGYPNYFRYYQYDAADPTDWGTGPLTNGVVAMGQAFWVYAAAGGSLTIHESAKATATGEFYRDGKRKNQEVLAISISNGTRNDRAFLKLVKGATPHMDFRHDLPKLHNDEMDVYFIDDTGNEMLMHALSEVNENVRIPIGIKVAKAGEYHLSFPNPGKFPAAEKLFVIDTYTRRAFPVHNVEMITFAVHDPAKALNDRFYLSRNPELTPADAVSVYPNPARDKISIRISGSDMKVGFQMYDNTGGVVLEGEFTHEVDLDLAGLQAGMYLLKVETGIGPVSRKIIKY